MFKMLTICQKKYFLDIKYLHTTIQCLSIVHTKCQNVPENKKCHKHVTNAPKGIGLAQDTFEER